MQAEKFFIPKAIFYYSLFPCSLLVTQVLLQGNNICIVCAILSRSVIYIWLTLLPFTGNGVVYHDVNSSFPGQKNSLVFGTLRVRYIFIL